MRYFVALLMVLLQLPASAGEPELISVKKIWDQGNHNAFTDLIRFNDKFYCTFREAKAHIGGDGQIRVLVSADGDKWESAALLSEKGVDLRDPKFSITPGGQLMLALGGSVYEGKKLLGRQPRVSFSKDGATWTPPQKVLTEGDWLWRVTWHNGVAYGVSYRNDTADWSVALYSSKDGKDYTKVADLAVTGKPNETTLRFTADGEMFALVRREAGDLVASLGRSKAPYTEWKWTPLKHPAHGPNFIFLENGEMWGGGRQYQGGTKTVLAKMTPENYEPVLTLPSGGDCSYPGFVHHENFLWMSYYSTHEGKSNIYLAKIRLK